MAKDSSRIDISHVSSTWRDGGCDDAILQKVHEEGQTAIVTTNVSEDGKVGETNIVIKK